MTTVEQTLDRQTAEQILERLGWVIDTPARFGQAVENFQRGWALGPALKVDGVVGPNTSHALVVSRARRADGLPSASAHFSFSEFRCHCQQLKPSCEGIRVHRQLITSLEMLRSHFYPGGLTIVSGYRCPDHNADVGGATTSQHLFGAAADIPRRVTSAKIAALGVFAGIGRRPSDGTVSHVDRRDVSGHNTTHSSISHPAVFADPA